MQLKDVIHYYLGCPMIAVKDDLDDDEYPITKGTVGRLSLVNFGNLQIRAWDDSESWEIGIDLDNFSIADWIGSNGWKPLLHRLEDITEEDAIKIAELGGAGSYYGNNPEGKARAGKELLEKYLDSSRCNVSGRDWWRIQTYLLSHHYDLFSLIESGNALDEKTLDPTIS